MADYLVGHHGFVQLYLARDISTKAAMSQRSRGNDWPERTFPTVHTFLAFVTKNWQQRWVTIDVVNEEVLESLSRRPFFLLVSVDAPVCLRWNRFKDR